jgi:hypothetical protein
MARVVGTPAFLLPMDHHRRVLVNPSVGSSRKQMRPSEADDEDEFVDGHPMTTGGLLTPPQLNDGTASSDAPTERLAALPLGDNGTGASAGAGCSFQTDDDSNFGSAMEANSPLRTATVAQQVMAEYADAKGKGKHEAEDEADEHTEEDTVTRSRSRVAAAGAKLPQRAVPQAQPAPAATGAQNSKAVVLSSLPPEPTAAAAAAAAAATGTAASTPVDGGPGSNHKAATATVAPDSTAVAAVAAKPGTEEPKPFFERTVSFVSAHKAIVAACGLAFVLAIYLGWRYIFGGRRLSTASSAAHDEEQGGDDNSNSKSNSRSHSHSNSHSHSHSHSPPHTDARVAPVAHQQASQPSQQQQQPSEQQPPQQPTRPTQHSPPQSTQQQPSQQQQDQQPSQQPQPSQQAAPLPSLPQASLQAAAPRSTPVLAMSTPPVAETPVDASSPVPAVDRERPRKSAPKKVKGLAKERTAEAAAAAAAAPPSRPKVTSLPTYERQCAQCGSTDIDGVASEDGGSKQHCVKCQKGFKARSATRAKAKKKVADVPRAAEPTAEEAQPQYSLAESIVQTVA